MSNLETISCQFLCCCLLLQGSCNVILCYFICHKGQRIYWNALPAAGLELHVRRELSYRTKGNVVLAKYNNCLQPKRYAAACMPRQKLTCLVLCDGVLIPLTSTIPLASSCIYFICFYSVFILFFTCCARASPGFTAQTMLSSFCCCRPETRPACEERSPRIVLALYWLVLKIRCDTL